MGIKGSPDDKYTPEYVAAAVANANKMLASKYATDQFYGILDVEPTNITRKLADNPPFAYPKNKTHYVDGVNLNTPQAIQRGYMRSLITDPDVDITATKNRRLFFQFNPQAIRREVSQTPGAMLPLLQSPEQLMQQVPGVSTFGFSLLFNREAEVNQGLRPAVDSLSLPDGSNALVSQVGVLADLLVLDSITGQGISQDLIQSLAKRQTELVSQQQASDEEYFKNLSPEAQKEALKTYVPIESINPDELTEKFNVNIGNSAFLNPLPFRVMFSTLFMVEGIATNVEVNFTKFSQTMVPTQCTVTISMYALYIGFAKKRTFLYDNLVQGAKDIREQASKDKEVYDKLNAALKQVNFEKTEFQEAQYGRNNNTAYRVRLNSDRTDLFKKQIEKKELKNVRLRISVHAFFKDDGNLTPVKDSVMDKWDEYALTIDGLQDIPIDKTTGSTNFTSDDLSNRLALEKDAGYPKKYMSFRYKIKIIANGDAGDVEATNTLYTDPVLNFKILDYGLQDIQSIKNLVAFNNRANTD